MPKALGNVMPRHLLDTRLNPSGELRDSVAARLEDEAPGLIRRSSIESGGSSESRRHACSSTTTS